MQGRERRKPASVGFLRDSVKYRSELPNVQNFVADNAPVRDPLFDELNARHSLRNAKIIEPRFRFLEAVEGNGVCGGHFAVVFP
jgi:hypothetical protein